MLNYGLNHIAIEEVNITGFFCPVNIGLIHIVLHEDSTAIDHLQSCFQACVLDYVIRTRPSLRKVITLINKLME